MYALAVLMAVITIGGLELRLRARGFSATIIDSPAAWAAQRERARQLGKQALVLIGSSRMQLDIDLPQIARTTGLKPVQLAIDGTGPLPVLEDLADDTDVIGTVLVDFSESAFLQSEADTIAQHWIDQSKSAAASNSSPSSQSEHWLADRLTSQLAAFADGATPWLSLTQRVLRPDATPQYLTTSHDRSRKADYSKVPMPGFMLGRAFRHVGREDLTARIRTLDDANRLLQQVIDNTTPHVMDTSAWERKDRFLAAANKIMARGGRVMFARLPTSGWVRRFDIASFPAERFGDQLFAGTGIPFFDSYRIPQWRALECPDGSHLDGRDTTQFSQMLGNAIAITMGIDSVNAEK